LFTLAIKLRNKAELRTKSQVHISGALNFYLDQLMARGHPTHAASFVLLDFISLAAKDGIIELQPLAIRVRGRTA
jgi:hypothetical protein